MSQKLLWEMKCKDWSRRKYDIGKLKNKAIMDKNDQKVGKLLLECGMQKRNCSEDKWQYVEKVMKSASEEVVSHEQRQRLLVS
jgi:hypothetical protein